SRPAAVPPDIPLTVRLIGEPATRPVRSEQITYCSQRRNTVRCCDAFALMPGWSETYQAVQYRSEPVADPCLIASNPERERNCAADRHQSAHCQPRSGTAAGVVRR